MTEITGQINVYGKRIRIDPLRARQTLKGVYLERGAQILRIPPGSTIKNIILRGGASFNSNWAGLRGAVLKFDPQRKTPIHIDGKGFIVPSGHTLMDQKSYIFTIEKRNEGKRIPHRVIKEISSEDLYLVHASYCHPDQLFLPQGTYTETKYFPQKYATEMTHLQFDAVNGILFFEENSLDEILKKKADKNLFNILEDFQNKYPSPLKPEKIITQIVVQLKEGGQVILRNWI